MDHSKIDSHNVVSLLLMAERMKVDGVIDECVQYCYSNMEEVLSSRFNVGAISDKVLYKLASKFDHNELEALRDKKDKIKSKLYGKLVERLFASDKGNNGAAASLFRCVHCGLFLTEKSSRIVRCLPSQMGINRYGELIPLHQQNDLWNAHQYLKDLYAELKSWRHVYWQIWGKIHCLRCSYCQDHFRSCDLGTCRYHLDSLKADKIDDPREAVHDCCGYRVTFFDPLDIKNGCQLRDHVSDEQQCAVYEDVVKYRSLICVPSEKNIFTKRISKIARQNSCITAGLQRNFLYQQTEVAKQQPSSNNSDDDDSDSPDDADERGSTYGVAAGKSVDPSQPLRMNQILNWKWNPHRTFRYNQDAQREYEQVKQSQMVQKFHETRGRGNPSATETSNGAPSGCGGIYAQLEADWRTKLGPSKLVLRKNSLVFTARSSALGSSFDRKLYV